MNRMILKGFLVKDVLQVADLETVIYQMRGIVEKRASLAYGNLVKWQVERIVDEIALNRIARPEKISILDMAAGEVKRRILYAEQKMQCTEFCLYMGVQVLIGKFDGRPTVYLKAVCPNDIYSRHLKKIPELIPYDIYEEDLKARKSEKKDFWETVEEKYQTDIPLTSSLLQYDRISAEPEKFQYRSPSERAEDLAKENVMNQLLAAYGCDNQIQPNKLMEYTLQADARMKNPRIHEIFEFEKANLEGILPNITFDLVSKVWMPQGTMPDTPVAAENCEQAPGMDIDTNPDGCGAVEPAQDSVPDAQEPESNATFGMEA